MIELYTWPTPNGHKVHIMLEETGTPYNVHAIDIGAGDQFKPEFLKISPEQQDAGDGRHRRARAASRSRSPSRARCCSTSPRRPASSCPQDLRERWQVMQWVMFQMGHIGPMLGQAHHFLGYAPEKIPYAMNRYKNEANRLYMVVDRRLKESKYLACDEYTIADMATVPWLRFPERQGVNIDEYPALKKWRDAIYERPAVKRAFQVLAERRQRGARDDEGAERESVRSSAICQALNEGKVAWITGGGSGIGLAGAEELVKAGARVVISGRTEKTNREAEKKLKALGRARRRSCSTSPTRRRSSAAAADIEKRHGRIDILVTSAGTNIGGAKRNFKNMSPEGWDDVVAINLNGLFYCCHAVIPGMRARKDGLIINISSWAGRYASVAHRPGLQRHQARGDRGLRVDQHGGVHARHPRHLHPARRSGDADPGEAAGAAVARKSARAWRSPRISARRSCSWRPCRRAAA